MNTNSARRPRPPARGGWARRRLGRWFESLALRERFLLSPLLGLLLLVALTAAFIQESQRQDELLKRIAERDFAAYDHYSELFVGLSDEHMALYDLLQDTGAIDEQLLYDRAKQRLNRIQRVVDELEQALPVVSVASPRGNESLAAPRSELLVRTKAYRKAATAAVTMATVNLALAPRQLALANTQFTAMNRAYAGFLDSERSGIRSEIGARVRGGEAGRIVIAGAGVAATGLLIVLSVMLARLLSRALKAQIAALTELGTQAGARVSLDAKSEVQRIAQAVDAFRQALHQLRNKDQALADANHALTRTLDELSAARDQLEVRVRDRTQVLAQTNDELRSEIERRREAEHHLTIYAEVIRSTGEAVAITDLEGRIVDVNPAYEHAVGLSREEVIGTPLYCATPADDADGSHAQLWSRVEAEGHWSGEILNRRGNGQMFPSWALINAVRDEQGAPVQYVCVGRDITALKQSEQQLKKLAFHDSLTGLPNRALFHDRLEVALAGARRQVSRIAVIYLDLDHFKYVNDTLGHPMGDRLLVEIGQRIGSCIRDADTLARMGGDEFTILLPHIESGEDARCIAERVIEAVQEPILLGHETVCVGASLGISIFPEHGADAEVLQKHADLAMYQAKDAGRGQYRVFDLEMLDQGGDHLSLSVQIDSALKNDEFTLFYQPIVNLASGLTESVEALIRWRKPSGEMVSPAKFIPHAEETGLIKKIDRWVLERACRDAVSWWQDSGRELRVCVNISAVSMQLPNMAKIVADALQRSQLPPRLLTVEITETAVISDPVTVRKVLDEISALGVGLSLDDFGTGYSSLSYLTRFPINCIKLDRSFVERIGNDPASEEVIRSLLELAHKLGLRVVAEGVERRGQQAFLSDAGCELLQGFRFARPMPDEKLRPWLSSNRDSPVPSSFSPSGIAEFS